MCGPTVACCSHCLIRHLAGLDCAIQEIRKGTVFATDMQHILDELRSAESARILDSAEPQGIVEYYSALRNRSGDAINLAGEAVASKHQDRLTWCLILCWQTNMVEGGPFGFIGCSLVPLILFVTVFCSWLTCRHFDDTSAM